MFKLERRILWREVDLGILPPEMKNVLSLLGQEPSFSIKGGYAKATLGETLIKYKRLRYNRAFGENGGFDAKEMDLDTVFSYSGKRRNNIKGLSCRINALQEKLAEIGIPLKPVDVEIRREKNTGQEFIQEFLETRDVTIDEVLLYPVKGKWYVSFTEKAFRDTINEVAILAPNGTGMIRIDHNRIIATPYAMARMIRFLTEKKVKAVYIPQWWIDQNNKEAERLGKENLGAYSLIVIERYLQKPDLQIKFMRAMYELKITDFKNFDDFREEQLLFFKLHNDKDFEFNGNQSFEEVQQRLLRKEEQGKNGRAQRKREREKCLHSEVEISKCTRCNKGCTITKCKNCTFTEVIPQGQKHPVDMTYMLCNYNTTRANVYHDKKGFYPFRPNKQIKR